jgi:threonine dehydrogenase-like Zn-dependent dehydrogenase
MQAHAVFHRAPHRVEWAEIPVADPKPGELLLKALCSAPSPGTETLIFRGEAPEELELDATLASLQGQFRYPFRYGYALVGEVVGAGSAEHRDWLGRRVFAFHPHQSLALVDWRDCHPVPEHCPSERALFFANLESAVNLVLDLAPLVGERLAVFGQGVVGLLTMAILSRFPLGELIAVDPLAGRRELARLWGAGTALVPDEARDWVERGRYGDIGLDGAVEVSGEPRALDQALELVGFGGRIVVGSWYGRKRATLNLGGPFHRRRIRLISSQVSTIAPSLSGRWTKERRFRLVWEWLDILQPERLITGRYPPGACQSAFEQMRDQAGDVVQIIFDYS